MSMPVKKTATNYFHHIDDRCPEGTERAVENRSSRVFASLCAGIRTWRKRENQQSKSRGPRKGPRNSPKKLHRESREGKRVRRGRGLWMRAGAFFLELLMFTARAHRSRGTYVARITIRRPTLLLAHRVASVATPRQRPIAPTRIR